PGLEMVARIIQYQAKGFDGSGFPADGVEGADIPFGARLIRVMSDILRLEATGLHRQKALAQLELDARLYDPEILQVCHSRWRSPSQRQYERVNRAVPMEDLGLLDVLAKPLLTTTKMLIAPDGTLITRVLLKKIRDFEHLGLMSESVEIIVLRPLSPDILPSLRLVLPMANGSRDSDNPMLATTRSEAVLELGIFEGSGKTDGEADEEGVPSAQSKARCEPELNVECARVSAALQSGTARLPDVAASPLRSIAVNE
ncbi:MAG: HD domain-containing phosphohydrolase, partial [Verrucomicrobiota bacterium]